MIEKSEILSDEQLPDKEQESSLLPTLTDKKEFVEPEVSSPVDVLETTASFMMFSF